MCIDAYQVWDCIEQASSHLMHFSFIDRCGCRTRATNLCDSISVEQLCASTPSPRPGADVIRISMTDIDVAIKRSQTGAVVFPGYVYNYRKK